MKVKCLFCNESHSLFSCPEYIRGQFQAIIDRPIYQMRTNYSEAWIRSHEKINKPDKKRIGITMFFRKIWNAINSKMDKEGYDGCDHRFKVLWELNKSVKKESEKQALTLIEYYGRLKKLENFLESKFKVKLHECNCKRCK